MASEAETPAPDDSAIHADRNDDAMDVEPTNMQDVVRMLTPGDTVGLQTGSFPQRKPGYYLDSACTAVHRVVMPLTTRFLCRLALWERQFWPTGDRDDHGYMSLLSSQEH